MDGDCVANIDKELEKRGISINACLNILSVYQDLTYKWLVGGIEKGFLFANKNLFSYFNDIPEPSPKSKVIIKVAGGKVTDWTYELLYKDWEQTAKRTRRTTKRPMPEIDSEGNIIAFVKIMDPEGSGSFNGKTVIVNSGHGGCMNTCDAKTGNLNVNFDPGTSNAVMRKDNPNIETNEFIANGGKAVEEWDINQKVSNIVAESIRKQGGEVIFVQGSVYSAQDAIRNLVCKNKVDMIVSLHCNSDASGQQGMLVLSNNRGGIDIGDENLAKKIESRLRQIKSVNNNVTKKSQSLGVLSKNTTQSLSVPGVLVEMGNLKNPNDVNNLITSSYQHEIAKAIVDGLKDALP